MNELPLTVKRSVELLGLCLLGLLVVLGNSIVMPLLMAFFMSVVLLPIYRKLRKKRIPEVLAIVLSILCLAILVGLIVYFLSTQIGIMVRDFPQIKANVNNHLTSLSNWISRLTHYSTKEQIQIINEQNNKLMDFAGSFLSTTAGSVSSVLVFVGLLPIYIFLMMFYKNLLLRFIFMWFKPEDHKKVEDSMRETENIIKSYLVGLLIQVTYMTILLGGILMIIGIKHALLIGVIFAILNLIPYIGALFGNIIAVLLTLSSSNELWPVITVLLVIAGVQFLDNNILMPRIVGSKVRINALGTLVGVFVGGLLAGVSGMFLSLPTIAVLKVIFDRTESFKQWGVLLGDEKPENSPMTTPELRSTSDEVQHELKEESSKKPL
ncbi:AI-2E family transporter [Pedobacter sp. HMF7647]|uniref:AI-2E family transporter n=1 Tax=Hufsiella arboris TaxID=2695275 RepID=A0A7K1YCL7_9SPHI|nr:AI-2E family transporter [Hufsiella arboris]MXV52180.1 AI-2E family transporter [Hufsiella arboris]